MTSAFCLFVFETFVSRLLALFGTIITSESGNPTRPGDKWERKLLVFGIFYSFLTSGRPLSSSTDKLGSKSSCFPLLQELMADLISQRDQGRQELFDTIDLFCKEVDVMPLQERDKSLQVW